MKIKIDTSGKEAIYKQLVSCFEHGARDGSLTPGELLPSMNELADKLDISKETVKKAYGILVERGIIVPRQGKGFYAADLTKNTRIQVLVIFDKFSVYKQILFNSFAERMGDNAEITILNHNQDINLLEYYLDNSLDHYDYYVIAPHFPLDRATQAKVVKQLSRVPFRKLIQLDRLQPGMTGNFGAVYQDFDNDIYTGLQEGVSKNRVATRLRVLTLASSLYGEVIHNGVSRFASDYFIPVEFITTVPNNIAPGDTFLVLNSQLDAGLVDLSRKINEKGLQIGKDVRIISYNEFDANELVLGGLTTVSTDFPEMGRTAASMILSRKLDKVHNPFHMTRRSTF